MENDGNLEKKGKNQENYDVIWKILLIKIWKYCDNNGQNSLRPKFIHIAIMMDIFGC